MDFADLKTVVKGPIVDTLDHSLVIHEGAKKFLPETPSDMYDKVHLMDFQPTCENLVVYMAKIITDRLPAGIELFSLKLYETATSYAEWFASDNS
jgi:6-pyruvoyltetrahydropterin/6-carboxytetrahydropterin synthase